MKDLVKYYKNYKSCIFKYFYKLINTYIHSYKIK